MKLQTKWFGLYCGWLILCLFLDLLIPLYADTTSAAGNDRIVRVGVYDNAPKIFISEAGKPAGIFIDIIEHLAKEERFMTQMRWMFA